MVIRWRYFLVILILCSATRAWTLQETADTFSARLGSAERSIEEEDFETAIKVLNVLTEESLTPDQAIKVYAALVEIAIKVADYESAEFYLRTSRGLLPEAVDRGLAGKIDYLELYLLINVGSSGVVSQGLKVIDRDVIYDSLSWLNINSMVGLGYLDKKKPDSTIYYFNRAIRGYQSLGNQRLLADALQNKGYAQLVVGQIDSAFYNIERSIALAKSVRHQELEIEGIMLLGKAYLSKGDFATAELFLDSASRLINPKKASLIDTRMYLAGFYTELFVAKEDYRQALRWSNLADSITKTVKDKEILVRLAMAPSRQTIQRQELELAENRQRVIGLTIGLALIVVIVFMQWRILRIKSKTADLLQRQNIEINQQNSALQEQSTRLQQQQKFIHGRNARLETYLTTLSRLANSSNIYNGKSAGAFREICKVAHSSLRVSRASIWLYDADNECLVQRMLVADGKVVSSEMTLYRADYPRYFKTILRKVPVAAADARTNAITSEFDNGYIDTYDVKSMLDAPFLVGGKLAGVICCEQCGQTRDWELEDTIFIRTLSDFVSIALLAEQINRQNSILTESNQSLEQAVKSRTLELQQQNRQLTEYAFINSHLLQSPLARILGLARLIGKEKGQPDDSRLLASLISATEELDDIVKRISEVLYRGNQLTREEVKSIIDKNLASKEVKKKGNS